MTTNEPLLPREAAPDHGPQFWSDLEHGMQTDVRPDDADASPERPTSVLSTVKSAGSEPTEQLPQISPRRSWAPLAAAAALLAIMAIGFVAFRGGEGATTELVSGTEEAPVVPLDGPATGNGSNDEADPETQPAATVSDDAEAPATERPNESNESGTDESERAQAELPVLDPAAGAVGDPLHAPRDGGVPDGSSFLANSVFADVTWYAIASSDECAARQPAHSSIVYVNGSGITQAVREPLLQFSGDPAHFSLNVNQRRAAWVVACGSQLELFVADLEPNGEFADRQLVWFGQGAVSATTVIWDGAAELNVESVSPSGTPFSLSYDATTRQLLVDGGLTDLAQEAGAPANVVLRAASPDAALSYWAQSASESVELACSERGEAAQGLWLRSQGEWQPAVADELATGRITAVAINETDRVAFADVCDGDAGRVYIGRLFPDGRLDLVRTVNLAPYIPGFATQLHWVDQDTLRIETDSTSVGAGVQRFDYRIDAQSNGVIFQVD